MAGNSISESTARHLLEQSGFAALSVERISTGKFNSSFFARLEDGKEVVLRVAPPDDAGFLFYERRMMAQEPGVHATVRDETSIPVAEILRYDDSREKINRDFLVMERLPGEALSGAFMEPGAEARAMFETGRHLRELHENCRADKYGYLGEHRPMEPAGSWAEAFREMWRLLVEDIRRCGQFDRDEAETVRKRLTPFLGLFDRDVPASLLHMDIWAQNLLVDPSGRVTGIVDWDRALWGDPEIEFAVLDYCGISTPDFWKGYGKERDESPPARIRWAFYYLYELQKYIVIRTLRNRSPSEAAGYKNAALRMLSRLPKRP